MERNRELTKVTTDVNETAKVKTEASVQGKAETKTLQEMFETETLSFISESRP